MGPTGTFGDFVPNSCIEDAGIKWAEATAASYWKNCKCDIMM